MQSDSPFRRLVKLRWLLWLGLAVYAPSAVLTTLSIWVDLPLIGRTAPAQAAWLIVNDVLLMILAINMLIQLRRDNPPSERIGQQK